MRIFGETTTNPSPFDPPTSATKKNIFTATNPFDFLSASSPRHRTPHLTDSSPQNTPSKPAYTFGHLTASLDQVQRNPSAPDAPESVAEKVDEIGEQVNKQVEQALAAVTGQTDINHPISAKDPVMVDATNNVVSTEDVGDNWEDEPVATPSIMEPVRVFGFPMRPFISITIGRLDEPARNIDDSIVTEIARLKKDFDQIDRNLVSATQNHIVYPLKNGGLRVIQQDSGSHKQIFSNFHERIFNISLGRAMKTADVDVETVVGTGVDGTVLWSTMSKFSDDEHYGDEFESRGFIFPAIPAHDENSSGGQLKTRVKPSSRTPELFAYGRGKLIHVIYPGLARDKSYTDASRQCRSEQYLKDHTSLVHTKKAGKDFAFSACDTVIATLDKAGTLKFWDIRKLTEPANWASPSPQSPIEIKHPILELATCNPEDKSWPTSVMFLDKEKPMNRGIALRYMIVGMKQNHTLQLWDLSLLKPVEEINFPHDSESDAICSLAYHSKSGILAVGHPTRNSIYLLSVSAPKYNLPPMAQSKYLNLLAAQDKTLPPPESTIILSGCREFSLGDRGQLRSLDILADPLSTAAEESAPLFELYVMHSRGITNLSVNRTMLGWSKEGKILNPVNAQSSGMITVEALSPLPAVTFAVSGTADETISAKSESTWTVKSTKSEIKPDKKETSKAVRSASPSPAPAPAPMPMRDSVKAAEELLATNGADKFEKVEKKKGKKKSPSELMRTSTMTAVAPMTTPLQPPTYHEGTPSVNLLNTEPSTWASQLFPKDAPVEQSKALTHLDIQPMLTVEMDKLYRKIAEDRRIQEAQNNAKQDAILRLVSTSLTDNIEPVMTRIVTDALTNIVGGPLRDAVASSIDRNLQAAVSPAIKQTMPNEIKNALGSALRQTMEHPTVLSAITDQVSKKLTHTVETRLQAALVKDIMPQFANLASTAARNAITSLEQQIDGQLRMAEMQHQQDVAKIDALVQSIADMQTSIAAMAEQHRLGQAETIEMIRQMAVPAVPTIPTSPSRINTPGVGSYSRRHSRSASRPVVVEKTAEQLEAEGIQELLGTGQSEAATIQVRFPAASTHCLDLRPHPRMCRAHG